MVLGWNLSLYGRLSMQAKQTPVGPWIISLVDLQFP